ncbi:cAMP-binding domain of CRP or a regulatory subunit of cAMP-dependent protein kinases [Polaribacter sp. KT25b]|uniref:Crp/Fnr family transcriptional regulator n=1 Tax=Polaribacter sp. KT25b TaxID=1855336 RepID=UPI00087DCE1F|nr:Crp/Fnr family transcriptional regulator [Polaribacter sp. KT25b]SDR95359.1 cAMP-binding domain of CRP or a regulatory subunit of cAMP-dependent protein kinases [Polaribacter sp. KT25b]
MKDLYNFLNAISPIKEKTWNEIKTLFTEHSLKKGEYFLQEGEVAKNFGFLKQGVVRAFYRNNEGVEYNKHFFTKNNMIGGYSSLVSQLPSTINQQALTDCNLLIGNYKKLTDLLDKYQDLERLLRKIAEHYFVDKEKREVEIVLLEANKRYAIFQREYPQLEQLIPQYHIASYLGITPTQLSRNRAKNSKN